MDDQIKTEALDFARNSGVAALATTEKNVPFVRMMEVARLEDDFHIWFSTATSSTKMRQVKENPESCVVFYTGMCDLRIFGKAEIVTDKQQKDDLYRDKWDVHYKNGGKEDPEYSVIRITPEKVEYRNMEKYGLEPRDIL